MVAEFKDGTSLEGQKITEALCVMILRQGNHFYLVSKESLKDDEEEE